MFKKTSYIVTYNSSNFFEMISVNIVRIADRRARRMNYEIHALPAT